MQTNSVGIREFRADLAVHLASTTPVAVKRHGQIVGFFIPMHADLQAVVALKSSGTALDELLAAHGIAPEDLVAEFCASRKSSKRAGLAA